MALEARGGTVWNRGSRTRYGMESDPAAIREEAKRLLEIADFVEELQADPEIVSVHEDYMRNVAIPYAYTLYTSWRDTPAYDFETFKKKYPHSETVRKEVDLARFKLERKAILKAPKE